MVALLLIASACDDDYTGPDGVSSGGGGSPVSAFVGAWEYTRIIEIEEDIEVSTTTWFFDAQQTCRQEIETELGSEGIPRGVSRTCTFAVEGEELVVTWIDDLSVVRYDYEFPGVDGNQLILNVTTFDRVT